jgi:hypothetical protein
MGYTKIRDYSEGKSDWIGAGYQLKVNTSIE